MSKTTKVFIFVGAFLVLIIVAFVIVRLVIFGWYQVVGPAMEPTLKNGQQLMTSKTYNKPVRGDIVVFNMPDGKTLIKRIVALPGERIQVKDGKVTVFNSSSPNGFNADASYGLATDTPGNIDLTVPDNNVFVMGDNRSNSLDSRIFGPISISNIRGKELRVL